MAISEEMVQWLDENISIDGYSLHESENVTGIDWQLRFQDFNDRNLKRFINENHQDHKAVYIISDLSQRARETGNTLISRHLNGFKDEADFQSWIADLKELQKRFQS